MCGFAGEIVFSGSGKADAAVADAMAERLGHRGPDQTGSFLSDDGRCAIGFRRLAVIDQPLSRQPMVAPDASAVVAFNGEIYNFRELRQRLSAEGASFRTRGEAEVLLELWQRHGEEMLAELEGMFAFVIYDARRGELFAARDRLGQKPLWYVALADRVVFASEAKALLAHPGVSAEVDPKAVAFYLTLGYVPAPWSIWGGIVKLPPAHALKVAGASLRPRRYWQLPDRPMDTSGVEPVALVRDCLRRSVTKHMVSDVPLGALLSGGVDSSIVVALMCRAAGKAGGVKTFTAGFAEGGFDERPFAAAVAGHLGTDHHELVIAPTDAAELLDKLVDQYDEPFADSSVLPTYLICRAAREHVTVALTGDGGDEGFGGYERYRAMRLAETMGPTKWALTKLAAAAASLFAPADERSRAARLVRFAAGLDEVPPMQYFTYRRLFPPAALKAMMQADFAAAAEVDSPREWFCQLYEQGEFEDEVAYAQQHDLLTYLPDDLLVKSDIASMASSLELRAPLLDHEVVALGLSLPVACKLRGRAGKAILRDAFGDLLPRGALNRRKTGFGVPIDRWLREELLGLLRQTLLEGPLVARGWLVPAAMERLIDEHVSQRADHRHRLWALLWLGRWLAKTVNR